MTPHQYADTVRLGKFHDEMQNGSPVGIALFTAGYSSSSRLYEGAHERLGMTPASYGAGGHDATLAYTIVESSLGWLCVGATEHGVCHIGPADTPEATEDRLRQEFHAATLVPDDGGPAGRWSGRCSRASTASRPITSSPSTCAAPRSSAGSGKRSARSARRDPGYREVAAAIGSPGAQRAVGTACGSNPVGIVVPCHRVDQVGRDSRQLRLRPRAQARLLARESGTGEAG